MKTNRLSVICVRFAWMMSVVLLMAALAMTAATTAQAASLVLTVNSTDDVDDGTCDSNHCSLREAITIANTNYGTDTIEFNIPGPGPHIIQFPSKVELPAITDPVVIDATTEPDYSGVPVVGLSSTSEPLTACVPSACGNDGLTIQASYSTVRGLAIGRFWGYGIILEGHDNVVEGNYIGIDPGGTLNWGSSESGIYVNASANNRIGGSTPGARNVISNNRRYGINMPGSGASNNLIQGNYIGTDPSGSTVKGNNGAAVIIGGSNNTIGGTVAGTRNIIMGNVSIGASTANGNVVQGNYIGTNAAGTARLAYSGVSIYGGASGNLIGGVVDGARNILASVSIEGSVDNTVQGNYIGTDVTGTVALGGGGVRLYGSATDNLIGGTMPGAGNLISGNTESGVYIGTSTVNGGPTPNLIVGNRIGTDVTGTMSLPNQKHGVHLDVANGNIIGGSTEGAGNIIAFNGLDGVHVYMNAGVGDRNSISANSIFSNSKLGINLEPYGTTGVTPNDPDDIDSGPNGLQNFPLLAPVLVKGENTLIQGTLRSTTNTAFRIEFFSSTTCDPSGYGEGETLIGFTDVTTGSNRDASFSVTLPTVVSSGQIITATATDSNGNTSEFSACKTPVTSTVTLSSPSYASMTANNSPVFDWEDVDNTTEYQIQVDNDPTFFSPEVDAASASSTYTSMAALPDGTYYWHVRSANSAGEWSPYSVVWTLTVAPAMPTLILPADGSTTTDNTPDFDWEDVSRATQYRIQIDNNPDFSSPAVNTTTTASAYSLASTLANGTYYWRAQAGNNIWGGYSDPWTLVVGVPPSIPTLLLPVTGSVFATSNTPRFDWSDVAGATQYRLQVDDDADFSSPVISDTRAYSNYSVFDAMANGTYYWHVQASNGVWGDYSPVWTVVIAVPPVAPSLVSPTHYSTTTNATATFDWDDVYRAVEYQIQVDDTSDFSSPEIDSITTSSSYMPLSPLANGTYYWHARANNGIWGNYSISWIVTIAVPPSVPALVSPVNGSTITTNAILTFDWEDTEGATQYHIEVDDGADFSSPVIFATVPMSSYASTLALANGTYYWHVRASNGVWSDYGSAWLVTIAVPLAAPTLVSPPDSSSTADLTPIFDWEDVVGASRYQLQVDDTANFSSPVLNVQPTASTYTASTALAAGTYFWRVRTRDGMNTWGAYGAAWTVIISDMRPEVATLASPIDGESITSAPVTYTWSVAARASEYRVSVTNPSGASVYDQWLGEGVVCSGGMCSVTPSLSYVNGLYQWRVQTRNSYGDGPTTDDALFSFDGPAEVSPPDLYISAFDCPTTMPSGAPIVHGDTIFCSVEVRNQGDTSAASSELRVYLTTTRLNPLDVPFDVHMMEVAATYDIGPLDSGNANSRTIDVMVEFTAGGDYYLYAWADANTTTPFPADHPDGVIVETAPGYENHERIANNLAEEGVIPVEPAADLALLMTVNKFGPMLNEVITYTLTTYNSGPDDATNVIVTDPLPTGLACDPAPAACSDDPTRYDPVTGIWNVGNLNRGQSKVLHLSPRVVSGIGGMITNTAVVSSDVFEGHDINPNVASVDIFPVTLSMSITKTVTPTEVDYGTSPTITYSVSIANDSSIVNATNVVLTDSLSTDLQNITATPSVGTCSVVANTVDCSLGSMAPMTGAMVTITATVKPTTAAGTIISNQAMVMADEMEGGIMSDPPTVVRIREAESGADLALTQTVSSSGAVSPGTALTYTLAVENNGPANVTGRSVRNTALRDAFGSGLLQFVSTTASHGSFDAGTGQWTGIDLNAGQTATAAITVTALGTPDTDVTFNNVSSIIPGVPADPNTANDMATVTIQIIWPDPIFINAGHPANGCSTVSWGAEEANAIPSVLRKNYTWAVGPSANWSLMGDYTQQGLIDLTRYVFILRDEPVPNPLAFHLSAGGQNLFGCVTRAGLGFGKSFTYHFFNLVPGQWKLYLAFANWTTSQLNQSLMDVTVNGTGSSQVVLHDYDMVKAASDSGLTPNRHSHSGHMDVHYVIEAIDVTVGAQGWLDVRFTNLAFSGNPPYVNGLGIEYVSP